MEFFLQIFLKVDSLVFEKKLFISFLSLFLKREKHFQLGEIELGTLDFRKVHFIEIELAQNAFKGLQDQFGKEIAIVQILSKRYYTDY